MKYAYLILVFFLTNCGTSNYDKKNNQSIKITELADSLFILKNITTCNITDSFHYSNTVENPGLNYGFIRKLYFVALDSLQKLKIIAPVLKNLTKDSIYAAHQMLAYFISKQEKVGYYLPIITWISGDDFAALILILLDSDNKPVAHFTLHGGFDGGPSDLNDSIVVFPTQSHSILKNDHISSYELKIYKNINIPDDTYIIDSISYSSIIHSNGNIQTKKTDSARIKRVYTWKRKNP